MIPVIARSEATRQSRVAQGRPGLVGLRPPSARYARNDDGALATDIPLRCIMLLAQRPPHPRGDYRMIRDSFAALALSCSINAAAAAAAGQGDGLGKWRRGSGDIGGQRTI